MNFQLTAIAMRSSRRSATRPWQAMIQRSKAKDREMSSTTTDRAMKGLRGKIRQRSRRSRTNTAGRTITKTKNCLLNDDGLYRSRVSIARAEGRLVAGG